MSRAIEIIDPEGERRHRRRRRMLVLAILVSLALFGYPEGKEYYSKWRALKAGRDFAQYLSQLKTSAILKKKPMEAKFRIPDQVDVYEVSSCGPFSERTKVASISLSDFALGVEFAPEPWGRENVGSREPYLPRFCYDPVYGSSIFADGLVHGSIFLAEHSDLTGKRGDHIVQVTIEGSAGDISLE